MRVRDWFIFFGPVLAVWGAHEIYCFFHPERRARHHWPKHGHQMSYFEQPAKRWPTK